MPCLACCHALLNGSLLRRRPVSDRLAKFIFLLLGIGILTPWNAFISAVPYFQSRICSIPGAEQQFEAWVGLVFNLSSVGALTLLLAWPWLSQKWNHHEDRGFSLSLLYICWRRRRRTTTRIPDTDESVRAIHDNSGSGSTHQLQQPQPQTIPSHDNNNQDHFYWLVVLPLGLCLAVFVVTDVLVAIDSVKPSVFLATTLWGMALCGACVAFGQAGSVAASGFFPANIGINPFVSGQAVGGVVVSTLNFLSSYAEDPQPYWNQHCDNQNSTNTADAAVSQRAATWQQDNTSTTSTIYHDESTVGSISDPTCPPYEKFDTAVFFYFLVGAVVLFGCIIGYIMLDQSTQSRQEPYEAVEMERPTTTTSREEEFRDEPLTGSPDLLLAEELRSHQHNHPIPFGISQESFDNTDDAPSDDAPTNGSGGDGGMVHHRYTGTSSNNSHADNQSAQEDVLEIHPPRNAFQCVQGPAVCIFLTFFVTLAFFPAWTSRLRSVHQCQESSWRLSNDLYVPFTFVLFNIFDLFGRLLAGTLSTTSTTNVSSKLVLAACCRCLFFPLLLMCVGGNEAETNHDRVQIHSDLYSFAVQAMFAASNGLLVSLAFSHAPTLLPDVPGAMEKASEFLSFSLALGLLCGSLISFPVAKLAP